MAVIAALVCTAMCWRPLRRCGFTRTGVPVLLSVLCVMFLVGARLWNVAVNPGSYGVDKQWYTLRMTGFSMYGGILGAFIVILFASRLTDISIARILDAVTIPSAVAFSIARTGCFLNGCCAGKDTDLPWGVVFPSKYDGLSTNLISFQNHPVHPTQIYEMLLALIGIPLCLMIVKKCRAGSGGLFFIYGTWFSAMRLAILPLRSLPYPDPVKNAGYPIIYVSLIVSGVCLFIRACRQGRSETVISKGQLP